MVVRMKYFPVKYRRGRKIDKLGKFDMMVGPYGCEETCQELMQS